MVYKLKSLLYRAINGIGGKPQAITLEDFLHSHGCTLSHVDDKNDRYYFKYQGGNFIATVGMDNSDNPLISIIYPAFASVPSKYVNHMRALCNHYNAATYLHKVIYRYDEESDEYNVDISYTLAEANDETIAGSMDFCFTIQKSFTDELKDYINKASDDIDPEDDDKHKSHEVWLAQELATHKIEDSRLGFKPGDEKPITLGKVLDALLDGSRWLAESMTVVAQGEAKTVDSHSDVMSQDLAEPLLKTDPETGETTWATDTAVYVVTMNDLLNDINRRKVATVTVRSAGRAGGTFYYTVTASIAQEPISREHPVEAVKLTEEPKTISLTASHDTSDDALKRRQEFDYMWKDSLDKVAAGNTNELSEDQKVIYQVTDVDIAYCCYWAHKKIRAHCYLDAVELLEPAFAKLRQKWGQFNDKASAIYYQISHFLGFCYAQIGLNEKAYYYLSIAHHANVMGYTMVLVELLQRMNDPRAVSIADDVLESMGVKAETDEGDLLDDNESAKKFASSLRWNRALTLLKLGYTNSAKATFEVLLNSPRYHDEAIGKLAEIEQMKICGSIAQDTGKSNASPQAN